MTIPNCSSPTHPSPTSSSYLLNSERKILTQFFSSSGDRRHPPEWGQQHWADCLTGCWGSQPHPGPTVRSPPQLSLLTPPLLPRDECQALPLALGARHGPEDKTGSSDLNTQAEHASYLLIKFPERPQTRRCCHLHGSRKHISKTRARCSWLFFTEETLKTALYRNTPTPKCTPERIQLQAPSAASRPLLHQS